MTDRFWQGVTDGFGEAVQSGGNRLQLALRNFMRWEALPFCEQPEDKDGLFDGQPQRQRQAEDLIKRYPLSRLVQQASRQRYLETLTYLAWLDYFYQARPEWFSDVMHPAQPDQTAQWLDVGAKNWVYVEALIAFIEQHSGSPYQLHGVELDPHRRYVNLRTRGQQARGLIRHLPQASYHEGDVLDWRQPVQVISHFLPFVLKDPHLAWGLPLKHFQPERVLRHELDLLSEGGLLFIINQGEAEAETQAGLLQAVGGSVEMTYESLGQMPAGFIEYRYPRYGWICRKGAPADHEHRQPQADHHAGHPERR